MDVPNQVNYSVFREKQRKHFICLKITKTPELVQTCLLGNSHIYIGYVFAFYYLIADLEDQLYEYQPFEKII